MNEKQFCNQDFDQEYFPCLTTLPLCMYKYTHTHIYVHVHVHFYVGGGMR